MKPARQWVAEAPAWRKERWAKLYPDNHIPGTAIEETHIAYVELIQADAKQRPKRKTKP